MSYSDGTAPLTATQQMIASCTGALVVSLFSTPFDVVKVRLQAQLKPTASCFLFSNGLMEHVCYCGVPPAVTEPIKCGFNGNVEHIYFRSTFDAFIKIVKFEGVSKLWKGLPPTMLMAVPQTVVYFTCYDQLKVRLGWVEGKQNFIAPSLAGVTARAFAVTAISPLEMIRTKLQSRNGYKYLEVFKVVGTAIRQEGIFSLWRGMGPTLLRDLPFSALYWSVYEYLKAQYGKVTFGMSFVAGATAGLLAAFLTTPFDVIKTHRQMELGEELFRKRSQPSPWTITLMRKLWRENGFRSLYTGMMARLAKVAPACAVMISTYEYGKLYFARKNEQRRTLTEQTTLMKMRP